MAEHDERELLQSLTLEDLSANSVNLDDIATYCLDVLAESGRDDAVKESNKYSVDAVENIGFQVQTLRKLFVKSISELSLDSSKQLVKAAANRSLIHFGQVYQGIRALDQFLAPRADEEKVLYSDPESLHSEEELRPIALPPASFSRGSINMKALENIGISLGKKSNPSAVSPNDEEAGLARSASGYLINLVIPNVTSAEELTSSESATSLDISDATSDATGNSRVLKRARSRPTIRRGGTKGWSTIRSAIDMSGGNRIHHAAKSPLSQGRASSNVARGRGSGRRRVRVRGGRGRGRGRGAVRPAQPKDETHPVLDSGRITRQQKSEVSEAVKEESPASSVPKPSQKRGEDSSSGVLSLLKPDSPYKSEPDSTSGVMPDKESMYQASDVPQLPAVNAAASHDQEENESRGQATLSDELASLVDEVGAENLVDEIDARGPSDDDQKVALDSASKEIAPEDSSFDVDLEAEIEEELRREMEKLELEGLTTEYGNKDSCSMTADEPPRHVAPDKPK